MPLAWAEKRGGEGEKKRENCWAEREERRVNKRGANRAQNQMPKREFFFLAKRPNSETKKTCWSSKFWGKGPIKKIWPSFCYSSAAPVSARINNSRDTPYSSSFPAKGRCSIFDRRLSHKCTVGPELSFPRICSEKRQSDVFTSPPLDPTKHQQEQTLFTRSAVGFDKVLVVPQSSNRTGVLKNVKKNLKANLRQKEWPYEKIHKIKKLRHPQIMPGGSGQI